eukprot:4485684-Prymnesium_polylepis.1
MRQTGGGSCGAARLRAVIVRVGGLRRSIGRVRGGGWGWMRRARAHYSMVASKGSEAELAALVREQLVHAVLQEHLTELAEDCELELVGDGAQDQNETRPSIVPKVASP